ncbi:MAG: STAS/SEC14 domain-containing protein [Pseudomonadota bacterium]
MHSTEPYFRISLHEDHCEVHSVAGGFWSVETITEYFDAVNEAALPLVKARKPIYALVDFSDFVTQDRATGEAIRDHLLLSQQFGLKRIAIVAGSALVKLQYRRLSQGLEVEYFEDKNEAANWLREAARSAA